MQSITDTINNLIIKTNGGLVAFWGAIIALSVKASTFLGGCAAEGAINKAMLKIFPMVEERFKTQFDIIKKDIEEMKKALEAYKTVKHNIQTENQYLQEVIISNDPELLEELRQLIVRKRLNN